MGLEVLHGTGCRIGASGEPRGSWIDFRNRPKADLSILTIEQAQAIPVLLQACPSFEDEWKAHLIDHGDEPMLYAAARDFARHLLLRHREGRSTELMAVAAAIELLHLEGSQWVKEFATIGLLEGVQNVWANDGVDPELFGALLGPESRRWWSGLNDFWDGKARVVSRGS